MEQSKIEEEFKNEPSQFAIVLVLNAAQRSENVFGGGWTKNYGFVDLETPLIAKSPQTPLRRFMWLKTILTLNPQTKKAVVSEIDCCEDSLWDANQQVNGNREMETVLTGLWMLPYHYIDHRAVRFYECRVLGHVMVTEKCFKTNKIDDTDTIDAEIVLMNPPITVKQNGCSYWYLRKHDFVDEQPVPESYQLCIEPKKQ